MALIDTVKVACDRLAGLGWRDLLLRVTNNQLDIRQSTAGSLRNVLATPLVTVDRGFPGFVDFAPDGQRAITPGLPGRSLLYHAFASPGVTIGTNGVLGGFPTLPQLVYMIISDGVIECATPFTFILMVSTSSIPHRSTLILNTGLEKL